MYTKSANMLRKTVNKSKCKRVANRKNGYDQRTGSTIGGSYGYGYARDSSKDIQPTLAPKPTSPAAPQNIRNSGGAGTSFGFGNSNSNSGGFGQQTPSQSFRTKQFQLKEGGYFYMSSYVSQPIRDKASSGSFVQRYKFGFVFASFLLSITIWCSYKRMVQNKVDFENATAILNQANRDNEARERAEAEMDSSSSSESE